LLTALRKVAAVIDVLIAGRLRGAPTMRESVNGKPYATFRIMAADKDGEGRVLSCIAFNRAAIDALQRLDDGDAVSLAGEAKLTAWLAADGSPRCGLDVTAHVVMSAYHTARKRKTADAPQADATGAAQ